MSKCWFCGSPGGLVNRLLETEASTGSTVSVIAECEWCATTIEAGLVRWIIKMNREGDL